MLQVGAVGFCMGGSLAIAACQWGKIHAAVSCYGLPQFEICPVSFAAESEGIYFVQTPLSALQMIILNASLNAPSLCHLGCNCPEIGLLHYIKSASCTISCKHAKLLHTSCSSAAISAGLCQHSFHLQHIVPAFLLLLQPTKVVAPIQIHVGTKDDYVSVSAPFLMSGSCLSCALYIAPKC